MPRRIMIDTAGAAVNIYFFFGLSIQIKSPPEAGRPFFGCFFFRTVIYCKCGDPEEGSCVERQENLTVGAEKE